MKVPKIVLKKGREKPILMGHPWIFSGAVETIEGDPSPGDVVLLMNSSHRPLALGFYSKTDIVFRLITQNTEAELNEGFWREKILKAYAFRQKLNLETNAYRIINAEADGIPGLIVDYYNGYLVVSFQTAGAERLRPLLLKILGDIFLPAGVYEISEGRSRKLEGLPFRRKVVLGDIPSVVEIRENHHQFYVDIIGGQKTGFFLDQRSNRKLIGSFCKGLTVLNCFSYTGSFSIYAISSGAKKVISVDSSSSACWHARQNFLFNHLSPADHPILETDVFKYLRETKEFFDLIILDPPAFAKTIKDVKSALKGYQKLNELALSRLGDEGMLATFSCSGPVSLTLFERLVCQAVARFERRARLLAYLGAAPDHPTLINHPEGRYLKGLLLFLSPL